ncbi:hypothetical protein AGMMS50267_12500 [Spirochaetia bacterium]|nr:hypothetical protein AGMMS50267_12500 [Spirochaetia bacterium]
MEQETTKDLETIRVEREAWWDHLMAIRDDSIAKGMKLHTCDEILDALADERAGGEGLERLWQ